MIVTRTFQATLRFYLAAVEKHPDLGEGLVLLDNVTDWKRYKVDSVST